MHCNNAKKFFKIDTAFINTEVLIAYLGSFHELQMHISQKWNEVLLNSKSCTMPILYLHEVFPHLLVVGHHFGGTFLCAGVPLTQCGAHLHSELLQLILCHKDQQYMSKYTL